MTIDTQRELPSTRSDMTWARFGISLPVLTFMILFVVILIRRSWICDDAYITFRVVDNLMHGYHLVYNIGERVQVFTHPLWMMLISLFYFFTREIYLTVLAISAVISIAVMIVLAKYLAVSDASAALVIFLLALSKAYVDFSTSGLENALSHLILVVFFLLFFRMKFDSRSLFFLSLTASLGLVNRMDLGVVFFPALLYGLIKSWNRRSWTALILGQLPFILWEIFATFYYGFPFPNTAYAKLNTGISSGEYIQQGLLYLLNSLEMDPITLLVISLGTILGLNSKNRRYWMAAIGAALYLAYVIKIGGDFMSGRFLTVPLIVAVILIARFDVSHLGVVQHLAVYGIALVLGLNVVNPTVRISDFGDLKQGPVHLGSHGVLDERMLYYGGTGLMNAERDLQLPNFYWAIYGENARVLKKTVADNYGIGLFGFSAGPGVYVLDKLALADPLLARIPAERHLGWRTGHMERVLPAGYLQTLLSKGNAIEDPDLHTYYDKLSIIVKGSLFSPQRLVEIWKMNTGQYNSLVHPDPYRYPTMIIKSYDAVNLPLPDGTACSAPKATPLTDSGIEVRMDGLSTAPVATFGLDHNDRYQVQYFLGQKLVSEQTISTANLPEPGGISTRAVFVPVPARTAGFDRLRILPLEGDNSSYCFGYVSLGNE
jgi:arabinofuranosyltransferase